jgi:dTDP-4-dehydrorhamnose reductase
MITSGLNSAMVAMTGAGGRLGTLLVGSLKKNGITSSSIPRDCLHSTANIVDHFRKTKPSVVINSAALSQGSASDMQAINVEMPQRLAEAAEQLGIPFMHMSTTATRVQDLCGIKTPYALSKKEAEEKLSSYKRTMFHIDALVGSESDQIDIASLALGKMPLKVRLGGSQILQLTTYDAASKAITNVVQKTLKGQGDSIPTDITIAGDPIELNAFIDLVKSSEDSFLSQMALEMHIPLDKLMNFADLIRSGCLSPEFLHLGILSSQSPQVHDNEDFKNYHEDPIPSHQELASLVRKVRVFDTAKKFIGKVAPSNKKGQIVLEGIKILQNTSFQLKS